MTRVEAVAATGLGLAALAAALAQALAYPVYAWPLALLIALAAALVVWRPASVLAILPAAMVALDFAPASGRVLGDEFDLLQLALLPLLWWRTRGRPAAALAPALKWALVLLAASLAASLVRGGWPWRWPAANALAAPHDPYEALRVGKGALWAYALMPLLRRLPGDAAAQLRWFGAGMSVALAATVAVVLWERAAFPGLFDFASDYRVTGPYSAMHTGGATIECVIAVSVAFAIAALRRTRNPGWRIALALLLVLASWAMTVTYSRNGWAALLVAGLIAALPDRRRRGVSLRRAAIGAALALAMGGAALPVLLGAFAQQRLAATRGDFAVRVAHWRDALALRDHDLLTQAIGMGLGRYPALHRERSAEPIHAGSFALMRDAAGDFLRLRPGAPLYVEQFVNVDPGGRYELALSERADASSAVQVALCEKWLLTSARCARVEPGPTRADGGWLRRHWMLDTGAWSTHASALRRPVKLAVFIGSEGAGADIARIQLAGPSEQPLLANGDFSRGLDHWYWSTDVDPPWHIHSLPVQLLFDQGWLGVLAWGVLAALALAGVARRALAGEPGACALLAALTAMAVSGSVNSLFDAPRILWLGLLLLWLAANSASAGAERAADAQPRSRALRP